ncbi:MAG: hypothetical protein LBR08_11180 [Bacteroidales bacterium]|jgi:hypothetical protein|nr:hypothetical protein [Bacteroidales bacterium]
MKVKKTEIVVKKEYCRSEGCQTVSYSIETENVFLDDLTEEAALYIYNALYKFLNIEKGGAS